jgi:hypothetical protein
MNTTMKSGELMNRQWMITAMFAVLLMATAPSLADINRNGKTRKGEDASEDIQRTPTGVYDQQGNTKSRVNFQITNYGVFGFNIAQGRGGTFWPRGRANQYIFAGGAWFGARKLPPGSDTLRKRVMLTYNPYTGRSWMAPGSIGDGPRVNTSADGVKKYRLYFSTDYDEATGLDKLEPSNPAWPIWDTSPNDTLRRQNYYGLYQDNLDNRKKINAKDAPAFVSGEDIFCVYKDTDLSRYEGGAVARAAEGFPMGMQIEQIVYSWGFGDYADILFLKYMFIHPEQFKDTLYDCWMAAVQDVDIALESSSGPGAANDRARYFSEIDTLNLAVQWTNGDRGEAGQGFGYLGFNFLESPAVDADKFLRKDRRQFPVTEQLGLQTMRNWPITEDPLQNEDRYNFISSQRKDGDLGPGDRRLMMATGPFHMRPGDSARIVVGIILAATASGGDATGTVEDMAELIRKVKFAQFVYNNNFVAPRAPFESIIKGTSTNTFPQIPNRGWVGLNNAVAIQWDSTSEMSVDTLEQGLDFMGYRIYRARRNDLDTFDVDLRENARRGPLGWKQIAQYAVPSPFLQFGDVIPSVGGSGARIDRFAIADVVKPGQRRFMVARELNFAEPWGSYYSQLLLKRPTGYALRLNPDSTLRTTGSTGGYPNFDKLDSIRHAYFSSVTEGLPEVKRLANGRLDSIPASRATDSLVKLVLDRKVRLEPFLFPDVDDNGANRLRPFQELNETRKTIIAGHIRRITNGRVFIDLGDDNRNGTVEYFANPERSEKLINNVDYYYAVRAYDEGDYSNALPSKLNDRGPFNTVTAQPKGARPGSSVEFSLSTDAENLKRLGGIYNIRLLVNDEQRFNQLFGGRKLELNFNRLWAGWPHKNNENDIVGLYGTVFTLRDVETKQEIAQWSSFLPPVLCPSDPSEAAPLGYFTEHAKTYVDTNNIDTIWAQDGSIARIDTVTFGLDDSRTRIVRSGSYTSNAVCFRGDQYAYGTIGLAFDYAIEQYGGAYRGDTAYVVNGPQNVSVAPGFTSVYNQTSELNLPQGYIELPYPGFVPRAPWPNSYNNGPGVYELTFRKGAAETITTKFALNNTDDVGKDSTMTFPNVEYLEYDIRNIHEFNRGNLKIDGTIDSVRVAYDFNLTPQELDFTKIPAAQQRNFPNPEPVVPGNFASASYGWRNSRNGEWSAARLRFYAAEVNTGRPVGKQLRYYKSRNLSTTGKDTLDFCHVVTIAGTQFVIDPSLRNRRTSSVTITGTAPTSANPPAAYPTGDFQPGDKVILRTTGGAFGFPFDNAKAFIDVAQYDPGAVGGSYTNEQLEQIQVAPNPYYVSHEGMSTPFEGKIYFTRLPRQCKISIYTTNGELVRVIEHNEVNNDGSDVQSLNRAQIAADVWDLLTRSSQSKRRAASQMFVAKIEAGGASVIRKFSVVTGTARFVGEGE